jgi:AraC-like DNA-binding protein
MDTKKLDVILSYIDKHICEKISLIELAELAGYSPFYFSKLFSETMGMPVTGYIRIRKLQHAMESLIQGKRVLDVSLMYSFDSHEGFTRSFKQLFGTTPSRARRYLSSYKVPDYVVPDIELRRYMELNKTSLSENMHQIVFEIIRNSLEEVDEGFCNEIHVSVLSGDKIRVADNGRVIPLSENLQVSQQVLDKIISGHPITNVEYAQMGDFLQYGLQTVNSLCESLGIIVYRNGRCYKQDYVRGIAQHELECIELEHPTGTEIILKPDTAIFGDVKFSEEIIKKWLEENADEYSHLISLD